MNGNEKQTLLAEIESLLDRFVIEDLVEPEESFEEDIPEESPEVYPDLPNKKSGRVDMSGEKGFPIICSACGKKSHVPFKPAYQSKVFCPDCFRKNKGRRS